MTILVDRTDMALTMLLDELVDEVLCQTCSDMRDAIERLSLAADKHAHARMTALDSDVTFEYDHLIEKILDFVLRRTRAVRKLKSRAESDTYVTEHFSHAAAAAVAGRLAHWEVHPLSFVALLVLLDQLPRRYAMKSWKEEKD